MARLRTTLKVSVAGAGSEFPAWSAARTENTWGPRRSLVRLTGEPQGFQAASSSLHSNEASSSAEKLKRAFAPFTLTAPRSRFLGRNLTLPGGTASNAVSGGVESSR